MVSKTGHINELNDLEEFQKTKNSIQAKTVNLLKLILNVPISYKSQIIQNIPEENRINILYVEVMSNKLIGSSLFLL